MELDFYTWFRDAHPNCKVGLRAFEKLKPFLLEKIEGSKHMCLPETCGYSRRASTAKGVFAIAMCASNSTSHCVANCTILVGLTKMCTLILCPVPSVGRETCDEDSIGEEEGPKFHNLSCLKGECEQYGIVNIITCTMEDGMEVLPKVLHGKTKTGNDNMVLQLVFKETSPLRFLGYMRPRL